MGITKLTSFLSLLLWILPQTAMALGPDEDKTKSKEETKKEETTSDEVKVEQEAYLFKPFQLSLSELKKYVKGFSAHLNEDGTVSTFGTSVEHNLENIQVKPNPTEGTVSYWAMVPEEQLVEMSKINCKKMPVKLVEVIGDCVKLPDVSEFSVFKMNPTKSKDIEIAYEDEDMNPRTEPLLNSDGKTLSFVTASDKKLAEFKEKEVEFKKLLTGKVCATCDGGQEKMDTLTKLYTEISASIKLADKNAYERKLADYEKQLAAKEKKEADTKFNDLANRIKRERARDLTEERDELLAFIADHPEKAKQGKELLLLLADRKFNDPRANKGESLEDALSILDDALLIAENDLENDDIEKEIAAIESRKKAYEHKNLARLSVLGKDSEEYKLAREELKQRGADQYIEYGCGSKDADPVMCKELVKEAQALKQTDQLASQMTQFNQLSEACAQGAADPRLCANLPSIKEKILAPLSGGNNASTGSNPFLTDVGGAKPFVNNTYTDASAAAHTGLVNDPFARSFASDPNQGLFQNPNMPTSNTAQNGFINYANPIQNNNNGLLRVR